MVLNESVRYDGTDGSVVSKTINFSSWVDTGPSKEISSLQN